MTILQRRNNFPGAAVSAAADCPGVAAQNLLPALGLSARCGWSRPRPVNLIEQSVGIGYPRGLN